MTVTTFAPVGLENLSVALREADVPAFVVLQQVSGTVDSATLASEGVQETGAGLDDLMAQLDALNHDR